MTDFKKVVQKHIPEPSRKSYSRTNFKSSLSKEAPKGPPSNQRREKARIGTNCNAWEGWRVPSHFHRPLGYHVQLQSNEIELLVDSAGAEMLSTKIKGIYPKSELELGLKGLLQQNDSFSRATKHGRICVVRQKNVGVTIVQLRRWVIHQADITSTSVVGTSKVWTMFAVITEMESSLSGGHGNQKNEWNTRKMKIAEVQRILHPNEELCSLQSQSRRYIFAVREMAIPIHKYETAHCDKG